jgi:hypothetical protein
MGTMQDFFNDVHEIGKKIAETPFQMYKKKLSKMSDRQVVREYWKQMKRNQWSKESTLVSSEIGKRRVEGGHDEIVFTLGKEAHFDRGCTCTPKNAKNDKNKFWGR